MSSNRMLKVGVRVLLGVALLWLLVAGFITLELWPNLPRSKLQWFFLFVFGPPLYILGETFFGWLFSQRHGDAIGSPVKRILVAVPVGLVFISISWWLSWVLTRAA